MLKLMADTALFLLLNITVIQSHCEYGQPVCKHRANLMLYRYEAAVEIVIRNKMKTLYAALSANAEGICVRSKSLPTNLLLNAFNFSQRSH